MRISMHDIAGFSGGSMIGVGVYRMAGTDWTLIVFGAVVLLLAAIGASRTPG